MQQGCSERVLGCQASAGPGHHGDGSAVVSPEWFQAVSSRAVFQKMHVWVAYCTPPKPRVMVSSCWNHIHTLYTHSHQLSCFIDFCLFLHGTQTLLFHGCIFSTFLASPGADSKHEQKREWRRETVDWFLPCLLLQLWPAECHELYRK